MFVLLTPFTPIHAMNFKFHINFNSFASQLYKFIL